VLSPEYVALIVITLGGFPEAAYLDTHAPDESVHDVVLNWPPPLLSLHDTVPEGVVGELDASLILTTNVIVPLEDRIAGFGLMDTVVGCSTFTERGDIPALPEWAESPA
jgi:hypothetical protein